MKTTKILSYAAAIMLLMNLGACSREEIEMKQPPQPETGEAVTIKARLGNANDTRLSHQYVDNVIKAAWAKDHATQRNDALMVFGTSDESTFSTGQIFDITDIQAGVASFTGNIPAGEMYVFIYPAHRIPTSFQGGTLNLLGQTQTGNDNLNHIAEFAYMQAVTTDLTEELQFEHSTAVLRINVKHPTEAVGYKPVSITLSNHDEDFAITTEDDEGDEVYSKAITIGLKEMNAVAADGTSTIYAVVFPASLTSDLNVNVQYAHESNPRITATGTIAVAATEQTITEGYVYNIPEVTLTTITAAGNIFSDTTTSDGVNANFSGGDGIADNSPFLISSAADLKKLVEVFSEYNADYLDKYYLLTTDIHVTATNWEPIGREGRFQGTFDGGGHTISGVMNDAGNTSYPNYGFFGSLYNECTIKNLHIAADIVSITESIGGIAGAVSVSNTTAKRIENCTMTGSIAVNRDNQVFIGGIIGRVQGTGQTTITGCTMTGNITATTTGENSLIYAGGIAGEVGYTTIAHCTASGEITAPSSKYIYAGGIAGNASTNSTVSHCRNYSNITVIKSDNTVCIGGITGNGTPTHCFNAGDITVSNLGADGNSHRIGGISGVVSSKATDCINEGDVSVSGSALQTNIGGIAGSLDGYNKAGMANCRNRGAVKAENIQALVQIGGLVGIHYHGDIHNSHNESTQLVETGNTTVYKGTLLGYRSGGTIYNCCTSVDVPEWASIGSGNSPVTCSESH